MINKLGRIQRELLQDLGREPGSKELAGDMDITPEKVLEIQQYAREPISLDQTIGDEGDFRLGDLIELCCTTSCGRYWPRYPSGSPAFSPCDSGSPIATRARSIRSAASTR
jgi:hypothetical protein